MASAALMLFAVMVLIILDANVASANASYFATGTSTSAATTSPAYMTPGTGTTTSPVYDAYEQTTCGGSQTKADQLGLLVQLTASSTNTVLGLMAEYSQDRIDWYRNYIVDPVQAGTTTNMTIGSPFAATWRFASSSIGGAAVPSNTNRSTAAILVPTPFRYTRIVAYMTGGNGAVWMQYVPTKEQRC